MRASKFNNKAHLEIPTKPYIVVVDAGRLKLSLKCSNLAVKHISEISDHWIITTLCDNSPN